MRRVVMASDYPSTCICTTWGKVLGLAMLGQIFDVNSAKMSSTDVPIHSQQHLIRGGHVFLQPCPQLGLASRWLKKSTS